MAFEEVGVEAIVKGLSAFQGDMSKINQSLQGLRGEGTLLQRAFGSITEGLLNFGSHIVNIAENALGFLLRDAIRAVIDQINELVSATIEAGSEFQTLELRLERLNFNQVYEATNNYTQAGAQAVQMTQDQLAWLQKLAATTPYDSTDVANVFTLARSYGMSADEAKNLTEKILDFAAGMGLGNTEIQRIIINFGQMIQQGKVTQRELNDLARGAFVPVNDILKQMTTNLTASGAAVVDFSEEIADEQKKLKGLYEDLAIAEKKQSEFTDTTKESTKMANQFKIDELRRKIGESESILADYQSRTGKAIEVTVDNYKDLQEAGVLAGNEVDAFFSAFSDLVETRFSGASEKMSKTFKASVDNVKDLVKGIFGLNTVKPVLDVLGERAAAFANAFTADPQSWDRLVAAASRLGEALSSVVSGVLDLLPSTGNVADQVVALVERAATWVEENRENIIGFFKGIGDTIQNNVVPFIRDQLIPAIMAFVGWFVDNKEQILGFFMDLGATIINDVVPFVRDNLIPAFQYFGEWFMANREQIILLFDQLGDAILELANIIIPILQQAMDWIVEHPELVEKMIIAWAKWQVIGTILSVVGGIIMSLIGFVLGLVSAVVGVIGVVNFVMPLFTALGAIIGGISLPVVALIAAIGGLVYVIINFGGQAWTALQQLDAIWDYYFQKMVQTVIKFGFDIGVFLNQKWSEISTSISTWWNGIVAKFQGFVTKIVDTFRNISWSDIGISIIQGIANGITSSGGLIADAAKNAASIAFDAATSMLGIHSPSTLFFEVGADTMQGMALGIQKSAGLAAMAMQSAVSSMTSGAMPGVTNANTYNNTSNYNLTVNSGASTEPILQDFDMLASLAGV